MDGTIPPEDHKKYLSIVLSEANRLEKLTTGLRELNSWNTTGPELFLEEFNMESVIASTVETFQGSCEKKNIELITDLMNSLSISFSKAVELLKVSEDEVLEIKKYFEA